MKKYLVPVLILSLIMLCAAALAEEAGIRFDKSVSRIYEGEQLQTVLTRSGTAADGEVTYHSSDPKVAAVDENGVVTGVRKGEAAVTATVTASGKTYKSRLELTVVRRADSIEIKENKLPVYDAEDPQVADLLQLRADESENSLPVLLLPLKKSLELQPVVLPRDATNRKTVLAADDAKVLRISGKTITGLQAGETVLTVTNSPDAEVRRQYRVLVIRPVTRVELKPEARTVPVGGQTKVNATVTPADAAIRSLIWTSGNEKIATVDADGVVTGLKRGDVRITAAASDGSNIRASIQLKVTQEAEAITLNRDELTVNVKQYATLNAKVLPKNTDDTAVVWTSSDEGIARVNSGGRVTGVSRGDCVITCASKANPGVNASAVVHVLQPVTRIVFDGEAYVYVGESTQLSWRVEPDDASNPVLKLKSEARAIVSVTQDGMLTGLKRGDTYISAESTDGSNRRARVKVRVTEHVTGVAMQHQAAYISLGETATADAVLKPKTAGNKRMTWRSADPDVARVSGEKTKVSITGISPGTTTVYGVTEDGGFETSIEVNIGDWDHSLRITRCETDGRGYPIIRVRNDSDLKITSVTVQVTAYDENNQPVAIGSDGGNTVYITYKRTLEPGMSSKDDKWNKNGFTPPPEPFSRIVMRVTRFQIDGGWTKHIQTRNQPKKEYKLN